MCGNCRAIQAACWASSMPHSSSSRATRSAISPVVAPAGRLAPATGRLAAGQLADDPQREDDVRLHLGVILPAEAVEDVELAEVGAQEQGEEPTRLLLARACARLAA